jgi:hypothetical protein
MLTLYPVLPATQGCDAGTFSVPMPISKLRNHSCSARIHLLSAIRAADKHRARRTGACLLQFVRRRIKHPQVFANLLTCVSLGVDHTHPPKALVRHWRQVHGQAAASTTLNGYHPTFMRPATTVPIAVFCHRHRWRSLLGLPTIPVLRGLA